VLVPRKAVLEVGKQLVIPPCGKRARLVSELTFLLKANTEEPRSSYASAINIERGPNSIMVSTS